MVKSIFGNFLRSWLDCVADTQCFTAKAITAVLFCLQVTLLALWSLPATPRTRSTISEAVVGVLEVTAIFALSYFEHIRSIKPPLLLSGYLFLTLILDIAPARTYWIRQDINAVAAVFTISRVAKAILLVLEETPKRLKVRGKDVPREMREGIISRSTFWWLNSLFFRGARSLLQVDHIGAIEEKFGSERLLHQLEKAWRRGMEAP